ncbi:hypothetical protein LX36DRAFT_33378 [Colletotrichum falcatum]|nr:hypothetical protein LX36DRAFT_33378 [Colletotrichum falcatum]
MRRRCKIDGSSRFTTWTHVISSRPPTRSTSTASHRLWDETLSDIGCSLLFGEAFSHIPRGFSLPSPGNSSHHAVVRMHHRIAEPPHRLESLGTRTRFSNSVRAKCPPPDRTWAPRLDDTLQYVDGPAGTRSPKQDIITHVRRATRMLSVITRLL